MTRDFSRKAWALTKAGDQPDRIAAKLHCTVEQVSDAVQNFEAARHAVSSDIVDMVVNTEVLTAMNGVGNRLQEAMAAKRFTGAYDKDGGPIYDTDHATALDAIDKAGSLIDKVRPKGGGAAINIGINNAGRNNGGSDGHGRSFEAMVRLAEQKRRLELGDGGVQTMDAEIIEDEAADANDVELDDPDNAGLDEEDDE